MSLKMRMLRLALFFFTATRSGERVFSQTPFHPVRQGTNLGPWTPMPRCRRLQGSNAVNLRK
jgi:hypothetical protein